MKFIETLKCIYCQNSGNSKEHIIADQLLSRIPNDAWIIKNGSCKCCQNIINKFETSVIRENYKGIRLGKGIKKEKYSIFSINGEKIDAADAYFLAKFYFVMPLLIKEREKGLKLRHFEFITYDPKNYLRGKLLETEEEHLIAEIISAPIIDLMKMLAKIAYGFYIFHFGEKFYFKSKLPEIIIKDTLNNNISDYIGSINKEELYSLKPETLKIFETDNHKVELLKNGNKILAKIDLFCRDGKNDFSYIVVCGECE